MSHVPTVLKSDRSVFDKMLPVDDNGECSMSCLYYTNLDGERVGCGGPLIWLSQLA